MVYQPRKAYVIGVGSTKFDKPRNLREYEELAVEAVVKALTDASVTYDSIESAAVGYVYGDSTCGQRVLYHLGMTQIPIINVNNNCSTGSQAFIHSVNAVQSGQVECALAVGFEKMAPGSLSSVWKDRVAPVSGTMKLFKQVEAKLPYGVDTGPGNPQLFSAAAREYHEKYGSTHEHVCKISSKNHAHSANNPYSQFNFLASPEDVKNARKITRESTLPMCSPTSDGGAAAVIASEDFVRKHNLQDRAVEIAGFGIATDSPKLYSGSRIELVGSDMSRRAAAQAYERAGIKPTDVQVVELHDCFAHNELVTYDALGLCEPGKAHLLVDNGDITYGGKYVVNPSGGLESKGHPLGATGLGMVFYLTLQVRGEAGKMQVPNVKNALLHNLGLGGSAVVAVFRKPAFYRAGSTGKDRFGYDLAREVRRITVKDLEKVRATAYQTFLPPPIEGAATQAKL